MSIRLLKNYFKRAIFFVKQMSENTTTPVSKVKITERYNGKIKKRKWQDRRQEYKTSVNLTDDAKRSKTDEEFVRIKRRKYAILLGYSGVDYFGMQRNPSMKTIEEDLVGALLKTNLITEEAFAQIQTIQFQRAARTDKGVSAARQVVSLKLPEVVDIESINKELPEKIRIFSIKRVTKGFNSKSNCDARTYIYMLPTLAFAKHNQEVQPETFRIDEETIKNVNEVLQTFVGTKNFHNFTSKKHFKDPSAMRYIISFECEKPFIRKDVEFAVIKIKGQSFMLHQIRKMIGLAIAVVRGITPKEKISESYLAERLDLPKAPGLGLVLEQVHYDRYNTRYGETHDKLDWLETENEVSEFKEKHIYPTIIDTELREKSMILWLEILPTHSFAVRTDNNCENEDDIDSDDNIETNSDTINDKLEVKN